MYSNKVVRNILLRTTIKKLMQGEERGPSNSNGSKNVIPGAHQSRESWPLPDMYVGLLHSVTGEPPQSSINNYRRVEMCSWEWKYGFTDVAGKHFNDEKTSKYYRRAIVSQSEVSFPRALYDWGYFNQVGLFDTINSRHPVYIIPLAGADSFVFIQKSAQVTFDVGSISLILE